jgi:hypothetical protein
LKFSKDEAKSAQARGVRAPALGEREGTLAAEGDPVEVLRGALQATKANGQPDWQIRVSAARTLAALPPEEPEPEPEPETVVYDLPPGSGPILHRAPPPVFAPATTTEPSAEPLPEPGHYFFQGGGRMILLVKHTLGGDEAPAHTSLPATKPPPTSSAPSAAIPASSTPSRSQTPVGPTNSFDAFCRAERGWRRSDSGLFERVASADAYPTSAA